METTYRGTVAFFRHFAGAYKRRTLLMVALLALGGFLEGISVITLVPLLEVASNPGAERASSGIAGAFQDAFLSVGIQPTLVVLSAVVVLAITMKAIVLWLAMRQVGFTVARVTLDLRLELVRALLKARWGYFGNQQFGGFANAISGEAIRSAAAYREACVVLAGVMQVVMYAVISFMISWQVTLAALVTGVLLIRGLRGYVAMSRSAGESQTTLTKSLTRRLVEALQGMKPMKAMAREDLFWPLLEGEAEGLNDAQRRNVIASETMRLFQEPIVTLVLAGGFVVLLTATGRSFSSIIVLAFVFYRLLTNINTLQMRYQVTTVGVSAFWSLREQIDEARAAEERHPGGAEPPALTDGIELRDVSFSYGDLQVLDGLQLRIPASEITALIGQSGSGKSTILDLIAGLRRPDGGEVHLDGVPLEEIDLRAWRRKIGYVPQEVFLFHDTVRRNVTLGDDSISDERVEEALRASGSWDFVGRNSEGIHALIAPQGSNLSGGQRQRLAIARALVKEPALLILDEATTGLDTATEAAILETLASLRGRVTILAVSHQPALRATADHTIVLRDGQIAEDTAPLVLEGGR